MAQDFLLGTALLELCLDSPSGVGAFGFGIGPISNLYLAPL